MHNNIGKKSILVIVFFLGIFISIVLAFINYRLEIKNHCDVFRKACQYRLKYIEDMLKDPEESLYSIRDFFGSSLSV
jgi:hypothetical protein